MKVFITKYALTKGIIECEAKSCFEIDPNMITAKPEGWYYYDTFFKGDWFQTIEEAVLKAKEMRLKKIASLKKQINKLEAVEFKA